MFASFNHAPSLYAVFDPRPYSLSVLWGGWGERKVERAEHVRPSRFLFIRFLLFLQGYPAGASVEERAEDGQKTCLDHVT